MKIKWYDRLSEEVILNTSPVIKDARKEPFRELWERGDRGPRVFQKLNKITFLWDGESRGVMRLKGHYYVHTGHTNNKYYNIPEMVKTVQALGTGWQCNTLLYTSYWWQFCFLEKVLLPFWELKLRRYGRRACLNLMFEAHSTTDIKLGQFA